MREGETVRKHREGISDRAEVFLSSLLSLFVNDEDCSTRGAGGPKCLPALFFRGRTATDSSYIRRSADDPIAYACGSHTYRALCVVLVLRRGRVRGNLKLFTLSPSARPLLALCAAPELHRWRREVSDVCLCVCVCVF